MRTITPLTVSLLLALASSLAGQTPPPRPPAPPAGSGRYVAIGCVARQGTASAPRYVVTDARGDKPLVWRLQGEGELLSRHVGHTVEVAGSMVTSSPLTMSVRSLVWIASNCKPK
jgi:hypothetical protein